MIRACLSGVFLVATIAVGCSAPNTHLPPPPPHGGIAFALPDGKGFVEVLRQDVREQSGQTQLVVYFLDSTCKPLAPVPTAVFFKPRTRAGVAVALKPMGDADASKEGGWASALFSDSGEIAGLLSVTMDNKPVSVAITIR